jgi:hypothetical protein
MNKRLLSLVAVAALAALPLSASTFIAMDEGELLASSQAVVSGKVLDVRAFWNEDRTAIVSEARVLVDELLAGEAPNVVVVKTFGGQVGDFGIVAHGFPTFQAGEQVLLYLAADGDDFRVTGYRLGQYRIRETAKGRLAVPTLEEGVRLFTPDGQLAPRPRAESLDVLQERIRERRDEVRPDLRSER